MGGDNRLSWKVSDKADDSSPIIPGSSLIIESHRTAAGSSPPDTTNSPIEISFVIICSLTLWSIPF